MEDLRKKYVHYLADMSMERLVTEYYTMSDYMYEEEDHVRAALYKVQIDALVAIGRYIYGPEFLDALEKAA